MTEKKGRVLPLVITLIAVIAAVALVKLLDFITLPTSDRFIKMVIGEACFFVLALAAAAVTGRLGCLKFTSVGMGDGFKAGLYILVQSAVFFILWVILIAAGELKLDDASVKNVLLFIVYMLLIGLTEELIFRGVLENGFYDFFGNGSVKSLRLTIIISGIIFGLGHISNIGGGVPVASALAQATTACCGGMILGAVFIRAKRNLWTCIILHAINDAAPFLVGGAFTKGTTTSDILTGIDLRGLVLAVIELVVALFIMRKKKLLPLVEVSEDPNSKSL